MKRKLILAAAVATASLAGLAQAAPAVVAGTYYSPAPYTYGPPAVVYSAPVQVAPAPAPIYDSVPVPAPRAGYVWSPGHYEWRGNRQVWLSGQWIPVDNYSYSRPYGDRDRDGVPNYYDRNDRNPYRY